MENKLLVLKRNASVDVEGIESALKNVVDEINKVNSLTIHDEESNKTAKSLVAQSRKDFREYDNERKEFKKAILQPYEEVDAVFKKYKALHTEAVDKLANDSKEYEENKRLEKENVIKEYFTENNKHDFITYDQANIIVINSKSDAILKSEVDSFLQKINTDIEVIDTLEDKEFGSLVKVEYEKTLDLGQAQLTVQQTLKRAEELKRKEDEELSKQEELVVEPKEEVKPTVTVESDTESLEMIVYEMYLSNIDKIKLNNFLQANGIKHEVI